ARAAAGFRHRRAHHHAAGGNSGGDRHRIRGRAGADPSGAATQGERTMSAIDFGRPTRVLRLLDGRLTIRLDTRVLFLVSIMTVLAILVTLIVLSSGEYPVPVPDVFSALMGQAEGRIHMVVVEWRLPRALLALLL